MTETDGADAGAGAGAEGMERKYVASVVLHALGDTFGFNNGEWEFNHFKDVITLDTTNELLYEFIALGGINAINLEGWRVSDDTLLNMAMIRGLLRSGRSFDERMIINVKEEFVVAYNQMVDDEEKGLDRMPGVTTRRYIEKFEKGHDGRDLPYDKTSGGNGAAMRAGCIGLAYPLEEDRETLIRVAIETSRLTHNSAIGYLGGLTVALLTAFAVEGVPLEKWPFKLIDLLTSDAVTRYVRERGNEDEIDDHERYVGYWRKYVDTRFDGGRPIMARAQTNLIFRSRYYYENFTRGTGSLLIGESGFCATIMAYDSLLDARDVWEKLVIYSALHFGDSDTVCAIASSWYGTLYGFGDVPAQNLRYLEFREELTGLARSMYRKYWDRDLGSS